MSKKTANDAWKRSISTNQWLKYLTKKFTDQMKKDGGIGSTINWSPHERQMLFMFRAAKIPVLYQQPKKKKGTKTENGERDPLRKKLAAPMKASGNRRAKQSSTAIRNSPKSAHNDDDQGNAVFNLDDNNNLTANVDVKDPDVTQGNQPTTDPLADQEQPFVMGNIRNIGNSCYMNATLYLLRFTPNFTHFIHHLAHNVGILVDHYETDNNTHLNMCNQQNATVQFALNVHRSVSSVDLPNGHDIILALHATFAQLTALENKKGGKALEPHELREAVRKVNGIFTAGTQQDAHEFLQTILNSIRECSNGLMDLVANNPHLFDGVNDVANQLNFNYFEENFMGMRVTTKTCGNCNRPSTTDEEMIDVNIPLSKRLEINDNFIQDGCVTDDSIVENVHCNACSGHFEAHNNISYLRLPRYLVVQLGRFDNDMNKIKTATPIPFTMKCFCQLCAAEGDGVTEQQRSQHEYHLYGIVVHVGERFKSGHYISYVKSSINHVLVCPSESCCKIVDGNRKDWFFCDDHLITPISQASLQEKIQREGSMKTPYVLFYVRSDALQKPVK